MSIAEIAFYIAIYAVVLVIGYSWINKGKATAIDSTSMPDRVANENLEKPMLGTGVGYKQPQSTYVQLSSSHKKVS